MDRNYTQYDYEFSKRDQYNLNKDITITPVFCGLTIEGHTFFNGDKDCILEGEMITVYYQMGNSFQFDIPRSLTIQNILFDALDSSLSPDELCLFHKEQ